jgi:homoserine dehydrogenase
MKKTINIAVVGLGQVGSYLLNELNIKKKDIELKTGKKINVVAISARNINKKRQFKINKKIFFKNPLEILKKTKVDILFEVIGQSDWCFKESC